MTVRYCGRCAETLTESGGCACGWSAGSDSETAVIPVVGGPELVRPYFRADGGAVGTALSGEVLSSETSPGSGGYQGPTQLLPPVPPAPRSAGGAGAPPRGGRGSGPRGSGPQRGGRRGPSRNSVLIGAAIVAIAGLGVTAALIPSMLGSHTVDYAQPQPGVTAPLPTATGAAGATADPSASVTASAAAAAPTRSAAAPTSAPAAAPTASAAPTHSAGRTPVTGGSTGASAPVSPTSGASAGASTSSSPSGSLSYGDDGPAVTTLQQDLAELYVDPGLDDSGSYDQRTYRDVVRFQMWYGVTADPSGVYGPASQAAMAEALQQLDGEQGGSGQ
ncbi:peptidoglycan-binding protein [Streptacidiphilus albus]|uniref:peptidoglycan-binding protein n=1 Tax=Streptacidiphilus albus TaxID=105425 RepID=UPI00054B2255|nr:peptidoglycan-binding protein [Streptacidiphilus albus]